MGDKTYYSVIDIAPKSVEGTEGKCQCDECKGTFEPKETLMERADNIQFAGLLNIKAVTKNNKTYYLVCPHCKHAHLFGFDIL